jgi:pyruvate dehydrogenase E2 component (dihydrolipoamide acetyltransferase)
VTQFTAIVTPPQVAILATGKSESRAVVRDGAIVARQMLTATLSADHRAVDGALVAAFLGDLKARLESPAALA